MGWSYQFGFPSRGIHVPHGAKTAGMPHPENFSYLLVKRENKQPDEKIKTIQDMKIDYNKEIELQKKNPPIEIKLERKVRKSVKILRGKPQVLEIK